MVPHFCLQCVCCVIWGKRRYVSAISDAVVLLTMTGGLKKSVLSVVLVCLGLLLIANIGGIANIFYNIILNP